MGLGLTLWSALGALLLLAIAASSEVSLKASIAWIAAAAFLLLAVVFGYWTYALATLRYYLDDHDVIIRWGPYRVLIPVTDVQQMVPGRTVGTASLRGITWWGCSVGRAAVDRIGSTRFFASERQPEDLLYLVTPHGSYALTIPNHARFVEAVRLRITSGPLPVRGQRTERAALARFTLRHDRVFLAAMGLATALTAILVAFVFMRYDGLPGIIALDFPTPETVVRVGDKERLLWLPALGAGVLALNLVAGAVLHAHERAAAMWLVASASLLQVVLFVGALIALAQA